MTLATILRTAAAMLQRNRMRSALCAASLTIGVAAVIAIVALGRGARAIVEARVMSAGTNLIIVSAGNWTAAGVRLGMGSSSRLVNADADAIAAQVAGVSYVSPGVRTRQQLINGRNNWSANVEGVGADLPLIRHWAVSAGSFFGAREVQDAAKVCVIGAAVRDALFDRRSVVVGRNIRIGFQLFRVSGVLSRKGPSAGGQDQDDAVFVPYTTAQKKLMGVTYLRNIFVAAQSTDQAAQVADDIQRLLRLRHAIAPGHSDDFRVRTLEEIAALRTRTTRTMTALLSAVAAVSLIVGGIGVMNIMLVSVAERTREIGLRLAVGARERDVRTQFLVEALLLSVSGGLLGVALGFLLAKALTQLFAWPTAIGPLTALATFTFSAAVGIVFGWHPARRAARTDPIAALHYE
jgi:putative ABC transport system permease protein